MPTPPSAADELNPYLLVRITAGRAEFARWRVKDGPDALALFLSADAAQHYAEKMIRGPGWQVVRPPRASVLEVLRACYTAGVTLAVLDPDGAQAKRVFPIGEILQAVGAIDLG
ncbi:MAG TPA: hypothetical protein VHR66_25470 [Gemmataceae bacterium]|jgi:hypothetical protein|nr:hypothetical protein [Gemmataceae bacterium]